VSSIRLFILGALADSGEQHGHQLRQLAELEHVATITQYLTPLEEFVMSHRAERLRAEVRWHEHLVERLPELLADERSRKEHDRV
jgi:hypothetical protein